MFQRHIAPCPFPILKIHNKMPVSEEFRSDCTDYREKYKNLKRKLKFLIYENECFQEELRKSQRKLLKVSRDKSFLLDRLMQYEHVGDSTSDSEATVSSDSEVDTSAPKNRKRAASAISNSTTSTGHQLPAGTATASGKHSGESAPKRKKTTSKSKQASKTSVQVEVLPMARSDGHMTSEEIERHLESRQLLLDLLPEKAPPTVPTEMFSNEPSSLDSETHEGGEDTSPSNLGDGCLEDDGLVIDLNIDQGCI